jgi:hypothetical protein
MFEISEKIKNAVGIEEPSAEDADSNGKDNGKDNGNGNGKDNGNGNGKDNGKAAADDVESLEVDK